LIDTILGLSNLLVIIHDNLLILRSLRFRIRWGGRQLFRLRAGGWLYHRQDTKRTNKRIGFRQLRRITSFLAIDLN
jgi:hypothetical protein